MSTRRLAYALAAVLLAGMFALAPAARAERIILRNGREIKECWILEETKASIVVAVIRGDTIGKIVLDPVEVRDIDRTREETLESALARARKVMEEERRRREAEDRARMAAAATRTATSGGTSGGAGPEGGAPGDAGIKSSKLAELVGPTTPEEEAAIEAAMRGIGDTRNQGGASGRREKALRDLVQIGPKAIEALTGGLADEVSYRRMNSARALADIAAQDKRIALYEEAVPKLIALLQDGQIWVRVAANRALEAISGQSMGFPEPKSEELTQEELTAIDKWGKWWEATKPLIQMQ